MDDTVCRMAAIVGKKFVRTDELELIAYGRDMSVHEGIPEIVVLPRATEQVQAILRIANAKGIPVTPRGAGTSVTGSVLPVKGGIVLDLTRMDQVRPVDTKGRSMVVGPGVICAKADAVARKRGLFFPPDPGSSEVCTIGGMAATNATGLRAVKYGPTRNWIKALEVVLPDGSIVRSDERPPRAVSGYDLTHVFTSSEGTLGVITELTLELEPIPSHSRVISASFDDLRDAGKAITDMHNAGMDLSCCEIMDRDSIRAARRALGGGLAEHDAMLIMEIAGDKAHVASEANKVVKACRNAGAVMVTSTDDARKGAMIWAGRRGLVSGFSRIRPGARLVPVAEDFGVPPSRMAEAIRGIQRIAKRNKMSIITFGHGDGNLHPTFLVDVRSRYEWDRLRKAAHELVDLALGMGGTIAAEHGIGIAKAPFIRKERGAAIDAMVAIKGALDPRGIMNPGKMGLAGGDADIYDHFAFKKIVGRARSVHSFGKAIDDEVLTCTQCGLCRKGCPAFRAKGMESYHAKGLMALAFKLYDGSIGLDRQLAERFGHCRSCRRCMELCPAGIDVPSVVKEIRRRLAGAGVTSGGKA